MTLQMKLCGGVKYMSEWWTGNRTVHFWGAAATSIYVVDPYVKS